MSEMWVIFFKARRPPPISTPFPSAALSRRSGLPPFRRGRRQWIGRRRFGLAAPEARLLGHPPHLLQPRRCFGFELAQAEVVDRKSTRLNSSHANISYAVFCLKKKNLFL